MSFFKFKDFKNAAVCGACASEVVEVANAKLEREGKVVYGNNCSLWGHQKGRVPAPESHKALLINIEPIAKCEHPKEKIKTTRMIAHGVSNVRFYDISHQCECGARVEPESFKECK